MPVSRQAACSTLVQPVRTLRVDLMYSMDFVLFAASPAPLTRGSAMASSSTVVAAATAALGLLICRSMLRLGCDNYAAVVICT